MINLKDALKLNHGLASLKNEEIYYIISNLFDLGAYGDGFIEQERLYINFDKEGFIRFMFMSTFPIVSESQTKPETTIYYGEFDDDFEEIEIYGGSVSYEECQADSDYHSDGVIFLKLAPQIQTHRIKPIKLVQGLISIVEQSMLEFRAINDLATISFDDEIDEIYRRYFDLYGIDSRVSGEKSFSGTYYLIAKPINSTYPDIDPVGTVICDYGLDESDKFTIETHVMTYDLIEQRHLSSVVR